jgi:hypothetical protein
MDEESVSEGTRRRRAFLGLLATVFAVTLAVVVGNRLSNEALAVIAGAVCGVGAAIPTSLIIVAVSRHRGARECRNEEPPLHPPAYSQSAYPPVVVVAPPDRWQQHAGWNGLPPSLPPPTQRDFTVVGGTPDENSSNSY